MWGGATVSVFSTRHLTHSDTPAPAAPTHTPTKSYIEQPPLIVVKRSCIDRVRKFAKNHWHKVLSALILSILAVAYKYGGQLSKQEYKGWQIWLYIVVVLVSWAFYEIIMLTQKLIVYLIRRFMKTGFWYLYFFISAFEGQLPFIIWSILVEDFLEWLLDLDSTSKTYLARVRNCTVAICIGISIRNLVLRYLFWEVHQKKLSARMQRFIDLEKVMHHLYDRFVLRGQPFDRAMDYEGPDDDGPDDAHQQHVDEEDALQNQISNLSAIQILKRMQEFDSRQKSLHSEKSVELHLTSQNDAILAGKTLFQKLDSSRKGHVTWKNIQRVLSDKKAKVFFGELKAYLSKLSFLESNTENVLDMKEEEEEDVEVDEFILAEPGLIKAFIKLFTLGQSLSQVSSAWSELSSGLKALCDATLFLVMMVICSILWGIDWTSLIVTIPTLLVSFAVAFGKAIQRLVLSLAFIFITKPYEVGDCVAIDKIEPLFFVESISVLTTQFRTVHNRKMMFPNWKLSEMAVYNLSKNRVSKMDIFFEMEFGTSGAKLKKLKKEITKFLKDHADAFVPDFWFVTSDAYPGNSIILQIRFGMRNPFENTLLTATRRSDFLLFFRDACQTLGITYKPTKQPVELLSSPLVSRNVKPTVESPMKSPPGSMDDLTGKVLIASEVKFADAR